MSTSAPSNSFPDQVESLFSELIQSPGYSCRERLSYAKYRRMCVLLSTPDIQPLDKVDSRLKFEAKTKYNLIENVLYRLPDKHHPSLRRCVTSNDVWSYMTKTHIQLGHPGRDQLWHALDKQYYGVKRSDCEWLKSHCTTCVLTQANKTKAPLTPIVVDETFERVQVDLIDMRHEPSGRYSWILHIKDHFSKYTQLYPLKSKHAEQIAEFISMFIMAFFPMKILQCDNGKEFKGKLWVYIYIYIADE